MRYRVRKNSLIEDLYLGRDGQWTDWKNAATFASQDAAEAFARKCGITVCGIF
ncbi:MAG: hypothetical protein AB7I37_06485 [Pirellulales bacterium]